MNLARGRRIAIDPGVARIGIAVSDFEGLISTPLATVKPDELIPYLREYVSENSTFCIYVGLPLHLSGEEGKASVLARELAREIADALALPTFLLDERLTTVTAQGMRKSSDRTNIDQLAAATLLEFALSFERHNECAAGQAVSK